MTGPAAASLLSPGRTAIVLVDLQEKLLPAIADRERILRNSVLLLRLAEVLALPVYELLGRSDAAAFKKMLPLLK